jgi:hypothetical protein
LRVLIIRDSEHLCGTAVVVEELGGLRCRNMMFSFFISRHLGGAVKNFTPIAQAQSENKLLISCAKKKKH